MAADRTYDTLAEWAEDRADMLIVCKCGRTINVPSDKILPRFRYAESVTLAAARLRCTSCRRRGHATITPVVVLRR